MQSKLERLTECRVALEIEADTSEIDQALGEAYKRVAQKVNVPGFRKGKAPRSIIEARYGKEILIEEALDILVSRTYSQALQEHSIEPIDHPDIEVVKPFEEGKSFTYKASVDVLPEVKLGDYRSLRVPVEPEPVTDEQVDEQLKILQERHATLEAVEKEAAEKGDFAIIDFEGFIDDKPFQGGAGEGYCLEIGSDTFIPGFEEGIVGMRPGEQKDVAVSFPEDYRASHLAGKDAIFKVTLREIKNKRLPEIDDELAKEVGFDTLNDLRQAVRDSLAAAAEKSARTAQRNRVIDQIVDGADVTLPEKLVEHEVQHAYEDLSRNMEARGLSMEQYMEAAKKDEAQVRADLKPQAIKAAKTDLVLKALADKENVTVTPEEVRHEVEELARQFRQDPDKFYRRLDKEGRLGSLADQLRRHKAADQIAERASGAGGQKEE